jgi:hypothetical protein
MCVNMALRPWAETQTGPILLQIGSRNGSKALEGRSGRVTPEERRPDTPAV